MKEYTAYRRNIMGGILFLMSQEEETSLLIPSLGELIFDSAEMEIRFCGRGDAVARARVSNYVSRALKLKQIPFRFGKWQREHSRWWKRRIEVV